MSSPRVAIRWYVAVVSLAGVGMTLGIQAVSPGLPELQRVLGLTSSQVGWFTTAYVLPGVLLAIPLGMLGDVIGRRLLFSTALITFGFAAIVQSATTSYSLLLTMRFVQGICFAAAMPLTITLIGDAIAAGHQRVRAFATRNAFLIGSDVVMPLVGAILAGISWRGPLLVQAVTVPLGIYSITIMEEHRVPSKGRRRYTQDLFGALYKQHGMFAVLLMQFSRFAFKFVVLVFLPLLLVNERNATVTQVGLVISTGALAGVLASTRVPAVMRRIRPSTALVGAISMIAIATVAFVLVPDWRWALAVAAMYGIGDGVVGVLSDTYAIHISQPQLRAGMVSINQTARNLGKLSSPIAMTAITAVFSLEVAFVVMAFVGAAIAPMMLALRRMDRELHPARKETQSGVVAIAAEEG